MLKLLLASAADCVCVAHCWKLMGKPEVLIDSAQKGNESGTYDPESSAHLC